MDKNVETIKRYTISGDQAYGHNRDSAWQNDEELFIYDNENGKWVVYNETFKDIKRYILTNSQDIVKRYISDFDPNDVNTYKNHYMTKEWMFAIENKDGKWALFEDIENLN